MRSRSSAAWLQLRAFSQREGILDVDTEVADRALDLRVAQQDLHGAQVSRLLVDDGSLRSAERMRAVILAAQSDPRDPLVNKTGILPGADVVGVIDPARKGVVVESASSIFERCRRGGGWNGGGVVSGVFNPADSGWSAGPETTP